MKHQFTGLKGAFRKAAQAQGVKEVHILQTGRSKASVLCTWKSGHMPEGRDAWTQRSSISVTLSMLFLAHHPWKGSILAVTSGLS